MGSKQDIKKELEENLKLCPICYRKGCFTHSVEKAISQLESDWKKKVEGLREYMQHDRMCAISGFSAGRPTKDGGYEVLYGGKWYQSKPVDKTPKCNCGLDDLLKEV